MMQAIMKWVKRKPKHSKATPYQRGFRWALDMYNEGELVEELEKYLWDDDYSSFDQGASDAFQVIEDEESEQEWLIKKLTWAQAIIGGSDDSV